MAWKQRRSQYQDHFPILEILPQKMRAFNHAAKVLELKKDWDKISWAVSGRVIMEQIQYQTRYIMI